MLSRLSRTVWFLIILCLAAWFASFWAQRPLTAVLGFALIPAGLGMVLALEFIALYAVGRALPSLSNPTRLSAASPTVTQMLQAWWVELATVLLVFGWWQPFRALAQSDHLPVPSTGRRGVVLVHGYVCNRAVWTRWFVLLREHGHPWIAVDLEPVWGSIDAYSAQIDAAVRKLTAATGMAPVLICHSMGGLAARAWLRDRLAQDANSNASAGAGALVDRIITLGTPHHGTWLAQWNFFPASRNAVQMQQHSPWLKALALQEARASLQASVRKSARQPAVGEPSAAQASPASPYQRFVCFYSDCDNIVFPAPTATLAGADNRHLPGAAHLALVLNHRVQSECLSILASEPLAE
jgi:triacylglycerol lipase